MVRPGRVGLCPVNSSLNSGKRAQTLRHIHSVMIRITSILVLIVCWTLGASANDWPEFRGPNRDGISRETNWSAAWPPEGPKKLWSAQIGAGFASISISDGRLFSVGNEKDNDIVWCLDATTGGVVWKFTYPCPLNPRSYPGGPSATPTVENGRVYTVSKSGDVYCLNAFNGTVVWKKELVANFGVKPPDWGFASSPRIEGDALLLNAGLSGVALRKETGELIWKSAPGPGAYASVVPLLIDGEMQLAILGKDTLFAVTASGGSARWSFPWPTSFGENIPDPVPVGTDRLLVASGHGMGSALLKLTRDHAEVVWTNKDYGTHLTTSLLYRDHLYGFSGLVHKPPVGGLKCVDVRTGETMWTLPDLRGSLLIANGTLLALTIEGELIAAEATPAGYKEINRAQILGGKCWTVPVFCNGRLHVRNAAGELACFDLAIR
jgi:outer membrane protein assembly factor BamB